MKKTLISIFLAAFVFINTGCPKPCIDANYSFVVHAHITPNTGSLNIGDTMYFISSFPTKLTDQNTHSMADYSGAKGIVSTISIGQLDKTDTLAKEAVANFSYLSLKGRIYNDANVANPGTFQQVVFEEINGMYELKIGFIPKTKGV